MSELIPPNETRRARRRRRSRARKAAGEPMRGLHLLPNLFTTGNLCFGFYAIVQAMTGNPTGAAWGIVFAGIFDLLDGRIARMTRATSRFGAEYDSIADTVSFGVAPAILAFSAGNLQVLGRAGWVMAFLYTVCAGLRLARFNVSPGKYHGRFEGLPSPAAAGVIVSTQLFVDFLRGMGTEVAVPEWLVAGGTAICGLLMVSPIPYWNTKELDLRHSFGSLVAVVLFLLVVIQEPRLTLFAVGMVYVVSGPIEWLWRLATGRTLEPVNAEPSEGATP